MIVYNCILELFMKKKDSVSGLWVLLFHTIVFYNFVWEKKEGYSFGIVMTRAKYFSCILITKDANFFWRGLFWVLTKHIPMLLRYENIVFCEPCIGYWQAFFVWDWGPRFISPPPWKNIILTLKSSIDFLQ